MKKVKKGQIVILFKSRQIIPQNEALDVSFSKNLILRSKIAKKAKKVQISKFLKSNQIIRENGAFDMSFYGN